MITEFGPLFDKINLKTTEYIRGNYDEHAAIPDRFFNYWFHFAKYGLEHPFDFLHMYEVTSSHLYPTVGDQPSAAFMRQARLILIEGQKMGIVKNMDVSIMNQLIRGAIVNLVKCNVSLGRSLSDDELTSAIKALWDAVKAK
jgi:hypothetical protein